MRLIPKVLTVAVLITAVFASGGPVGAGQAKTVVCHIEGNGTTIAITIADPAAPAHLEHGDGFPGDAVPGMAGYEYDQTCAPLMGNGPPVATSFPISLMEDSVLDALVGSPLTFFAEDPDGDLLVFSLATGAANGVAIVTEDGGFNYAPDHDYYGPDSFSYQACDPSGACDTATVDVTVAQGIVIPPGSVETIWDLPTVSTGQSVEWILDYSLPDPAGWSIFTATYRDLDLEGLTLTILEEPVLGEFSFDFSTYEFRYQTNVEYHGTDAIDWLSYQVCDVDGNCSGVDRIGLSYELSIPPQP